MLRTIRLILDIILIILCLFMTAVVYYGGSLWFIPGVCTILLVAAIHIYAWQINKLLSKSVKEFEKNYQEYLEAMGYNNGDGVKE